MYNETHREIMHAESQYLAKQQEITENTRLKDLKNKETTLENSNHKFKELVGISKLKAAVSDELSVQKSKKLEVEKEIKEIEERYKRLYHAGKQHVPNWATHGGIASGIAGGVAGAMVAMDVKQRADAAKENNAMFGASLSMVQANTTKPLYQKLNIIKNEIEKLNKILEKADTVLTENISEEVLLSKIYPKCEEFCISDTGAITMNITSHRSVFLIFDDAKAVVDGTIEVLLMNEDKQVGTAYFSLPYTGSADTYNVKVCCTNNNEQVTDVKFKPYHLWAVEKI